MAIEFNFLWEFYEYMSLIATVNVIFILIKRFERRNPNFTVACNDEKNSNALQSCNFAVDKQVLTAVTTTPFDEDETRNFLQ
jgi:hypothetical protein